MRRQGFSIGIQFNRQFGFLETFSFLGEGVGAVLYIGGAIVGSLPVAALGAFLVFLAVVALLGHLGTPFRTWRALTNGSISLASRGTIAMSGYLAVSAVWMTLEFLKFQSSLSNIFFVASLLLAVPVVFYAGFLLRSARAIGLWRGPYLPFAFCAQSLASGLVVFVFLAQLDPTNNTDVLKWIGAAIASLILCALISLVHLATSKRTRGVSASLDRILHGDLRARFYWGVWCLGIIVPLMVFFVLYLGYPQNGESSQLLLAVTVLCRLIGDYAYRRVIVLAGAYESILG